MSLRSKHQRAARLQRLHQTALRLISTHGIYGWRLHQLAKELNYTTAALYRYYPSKELLLEALQKKSLADMRSSLSKLIAQSNLTPLGTVLLCTEFYVCYARCSPTSFSLNSNILAHPTAILQGEGRKTLIDLMKELLTLFATPISQSALSNRIPVMQKALCLWSALHGILLTQKYRGDFPVPQASDLVPSLIIGWGATPSQIITAQEELSSFLQDTSLSSFASLDVQEPS